MKKYILILFVTLFSASHSVAENINQQVEKSYHDRDFSTVITLLENEAKKQKESGKESFQLYYNLGNAYFRSNNLAKAILNYERALLIKPNDKETKINIEFTQSKIEDKFAEKDTFILTIVANAIENLGSTNMWATISIILFLILVASLAIFFFTKQIVLKKGMFYLGIVCFALLILSNIFAFRQKSKIENRNAAIVMASPVPAYNSPNISDKAVFTLHSGSKVTIKKEDGDWVQIEIVSGEKGWIERSKIEII
ncbi:MAG: SH3 domain-containing protein [Dysgonomonas sp.]